MIDELLSLLQSAYVHASEARDEARDASCSADEAVDRANRNCDALDAAMKLREQQLAQE